MIKKLSALILSGMMIVLLAACNTTTYKHNYTFSGEGDVWSAEYVQKATEKFIDKKGVRSDYETWFDSTIELKYKGELTDLDKISSFKYSFKGTSGGGSKTLEDVKGVRKSELKSERAGSGAFEHEDSIIKVVVEWDGQKDEFELKVRK
ncbi:hypothetical protein QNH28_11275 [Paenibacillus sp. G2S3]|uniref:hypothetical protein n=1 Tax=Paenibacillus sp. G2S3 TaxID=3047872 RepID=UPI0024C16E41|nr:hypothetical protein [Paenibacillus sp. G2S3]WHY21520.1 hypothetical protein QNH28_11275 [Paenibacillus sp. G2S3]